MRMGAGPDSFAPMAIIARGAGLARNKDGTG